MVAVWPLGELDDVGGVNCGVGRTVGWTGRVSG